MNKEEQIEYIKEHFPYAENNKTNRRVRATFFDSIDTEIQAYLLGFHTADGCVDLSRNTFRVDLQENDSEIIYLFKDFIAPDARVFNTKGYESVDKRTNKTYTKHNMFGVNIYCKYLTEQLHSIGLGENKTYQELHIPIMEHSLVRHFIRGYFDGDGCITGSIRKPYGKKCPNWGFRRVVSFTSKTKTLFEDIKAHLEDIGFEHCNIVYAKTRDCYKLDIADSQLPRLFDFFYKDSNFYLQRKYDKFYHYVNTEVTQLIAEHRNAQEMRDSNTNNSPTSVEHPTGMKMCAELIGNCEN